MKRSLRKRLGLILYIALLTTAAVLFIRAVFIRRITNFQLLTENHGYEFHKESQFNPRDPTFAIFQHVNCLNGPTHECPSSVVGSDRGVYFHWDDWVDLSSGDGILGNMKRELPDGHCQSDVVEFSSVSADVLEAYNTKVQRSMANLYCLQPVPDRLVIMSDKSQVHVPVIGKRRLGEAIRQNPTKRQLWKQMRKIDKNQGIFNSFPNMKLENRIQIDESSFEFDVEEELHCLETRQIYTVEEQEYLEFLKFANKYTDQASTYFKYPNVYSDFFTKVFHHIAYPFFTRTVLGRERQAVIQHMIRAWFQFAEAHGIVSWVNYGSLLGWAYNGVNLPWDTDVDIQIPIAHLARIGQNLNNTLVIENPRFGNAKYLFIISPTYVKQGSGKNFIDARFIEINSGLYIDISALSKPKEKPPKFIRETNSTPLRCKNWNWHPLEEIFPIRKTFFEGGSVYIPNKVSPILDRKYGKTSYVTKWRFLNHNYQPDINMWLPDRLCDATPQGPRWNDLGQTSLNLEGACGESSIQDEYKIVYNCSQRHKELNKDIDNPIENVKLPDLPVYRKDPWEYYADAAKDANYDWFTEIV